MKSLYRTFLIIIRFCNLCFCLLLIFFAFSLLILVVGTSRSDFLDKIISLLAIGIPLMSVIFLYERFIDTFRKDKSSKLVIVIELIFVALTFIWALLYQFLMITDLFDIVTFFGLLVVKVLTIIIVLDSIKDYKELRILKNE